MSRRPVEELRPREILRVVNGSGVVFVPVSPCIEWHSYQLPMGVDGLIAESVAQRLADAFDGAYTRALSFGLDETRSAEFKSQVGLDPEAHVFGMNFPTLPLASEYSTPTAMDGAVAARLEALRGSGFRRAFVVNHHGGRGQVDALQRLAADASAGVFRAEVVCPARFSSFEAPPGHEMDFRVGGHAGLAETLQLMAFRPELVDLADLPDGPLSAAAYGILHREPVIPAEFNPRRAVPDLARAWGENVIANLTRHVRERMQAAAADEGRP